jgi:hypothetical protein
MRARVRVLYVLVYLAAFLTATCSAEEFKLSLDCLTNWRHMLSLNTYEKRSWIRPFADVPCVRDNFGFTPNPDIEKDVDSRQWLWWACERGENSCKNFAAKCTASDDAFVENSIFYDALAPLYVERSGLRTLYGGRGWRCDICQKGTYRSKDKTKCLTCPSGFIGARFPEDPNSFIPEDVKVATNLVKQQTWPSPSFYVFGCRACSVLNGIPKDGICVPCAATHYQQSSMITVEHPTAGSFSVSVGIACKQCPAGYEFFNKAVNNRETPCRSSDANNCCRPCKENQFSPGGSQCVNFPEQDVGLDSNNAFAAFGASAHRPCRLGEELIYCRNSECDTRYNKGQVGWRTCKPCALSGTKKQFDGTGCGECKDEKKELPTQGKPNECTHCSLCYKLEIVPETVTLHVIPPDMLDKHNLESRFSAGTYLTEKTTAECKLLARRLVYDADGTTLYNDEYRKTIYDSTVYQVPSFHTVIRVLNNCTLKKCSEVCDGIFEYSPGCGPQISNAEDMWVIYGQNKTTLKSVNDQETLKKGLFVTNGPCRVCKTCEKGYYNDECNVYRDGVHPQGMCKSCRTKCDAGEYMHHKDGDGRCDFPLSTRQHTDSLWKVTSNYECRRCPTWVLEKRNDKQFIHTVTACGDRSQYEALGFDINNNLAIQTKSIQNWNEQEKDSAILGAQWKKYRSFMKDLQPYCPELYFYDFSVAGCEMDSLLLYEKDTYTIPNSIPPRNVTVGFRRHNPNCCVLCKEPNPLTDKKGPDWQQCRGNTTTDVQNSYVKRCGRGYWEDRESAQEMDGGNVSVCKKCKTCHEGMILDS